MPTMMNDPISIRWRGWRGLPAIVAYLKSINWRGHLNVELDTSPWRPPKESARITANYIRNTLKIELLKPVMTKSAFPLPQDFMPEDWRDAVLVGRIDMGDGPRQCCEGRPGVRCQQIRATVSGVAEKWNGVPKARI